MKILDKETKQEIVSLSIFGLLAMAISFAYVAWVAYSHAMESVAYDFFTTFLVCIAMLLLPMAVQLHYAREETQKPKL